ncbi:MAG: 2-oxoacid:ferredoxin oxidoreductase subunit beta [Candidatus Electrothrix sp. YB6]
MSTPMQALTHKYFRHKKLFPHVWCPGCGNGIVMGALLRAVAGLGLEKDQVMLVSGIGCSGRMPAYLDFNTLHTTHGRALTFSTGIKLVKPALNVVTIMGDGDATAIGGNHFIHAARRNLNLTAVIINNSIYGMTGGQYSPTTPLGSLTTTSVYGHVERPFSIAELAMTAGASFVSRTTVYHAAMADQLIAQAVMKPGFAVVEIISNCHVQYGRRNKLGNAADMLTQFKEQSVTVRQAESMSQEELQEKTIIGVLADRDLPVSTDEYEKVREQAGKQQEAP